MTSTGTPLAAARGVEVLERGQLRLVVGHDDLAAPAERQSVFLDEGVQQLVSPTGELCFQGVGCVVEARVQDAAVTAGRVLGDMVLLVQQDDRQIGPQSSDAIRQGEADDPATDDGDIETVTHTATV